jgi:Enoyl-(Acyl carrier protein) reductase
VAVLSLTPANVDSVVADIQAAGGTALGVVCDISDADQIKAAVDKVVAAYGGIDILLNSAFDPSAVLSSIIDLSVEQLQRNFETGPIAYLRTMQACYPHLKTSGDGRIINFASMAGVLGMVGYGPYDMAKEAVRALTRVAAREWGADKITVNKFFRLRTLGARATLLRRPMRLSAMDRRRRTSRRSSCSSRARMRGSSRATASPPMEARSSTARAEPQRSAERLTSSSWSDTEAIGLHETTRRPCSARRSAAHFLVKPADVGSLRTE